MKQIIAKTQSFFRVAPFFLIVIGVILYLFFGKNITAEQIFNFTPENYYLAIIFLLVMYAVKSLSVIFPLLILYISTGMIFPPYLAIIVNIAGIAVALSIPYWIGHFSGSQSTNQLIEKYPKLQQINHLKHNNEFFFIFIIRIVGIIPMDVVSIFMGSIGTSYRKYLVASIFAMMPNLLAITYIGATIDEPGSPGFMIAFAANIIIISISILVYKKTAKKKFE